MSAVVLVASTVVQVTCSASGGQCLRCDETSNVVSLLQTKLQTNAFKDGVQEASGDNAKVLAGEGVSQLQVEMKLPADATQMYLERSETPDDFFNKREAEVQPYSARKISQLSLSRGNPVSLNRDAPIVVSSCADLSHSDDDWEQQRREALKDLCADPEMASMFEVTLDPAFKEQYNKYYGDDGWTDTAWLNFVGVKGHNDKFGLLTKKMAESVRRASKHPLVIVVFGEVPLTDILSQDFPNVVLLRAKGIPENKHLSFNFNKLRAILTAKIRTGMSLDGDMLMVTKKADSLLERTRQEINKGYPFPMMPVHFLDRDPNDERGKGNFGVRREGHPEDKGWRPLQTNFLLYTCDGCPDSTMRWGQAQPSWTYWSLPFISRWLSAKMHGQTLLGVNVKSVDEDEDLLNVGLWAEGATKSWCQFQPAASFAWIDEHLIPQVGFGEWYDDPHYFPKGVPMGMFIFHGQKEVDGYAVALKVLNEKASQVDAAKPYVFNDKWYDSFAEMKKDVPDLTCTL